MLIKICGIKREKDIEYVNKLKPDFIGFVFALNSNRAIDIEKALKLKNMLDKDVKVVGVFRNNNIDLIRDIIELNIIDYIQLHGDESDDYIKQIKLFSRLPIIKAYRNSTYADYILYDNIDPGKGKSFDRDLVKNDKPFFLAGGININNVDDAIALKPYCIDVSSGVETNGVKDYKKMKTLIEKIKDEM